MQMLISTSLLSFFSLVVLFLLTKIMGYRQISQLSAFDYINGITIGSIAAEMAIAEPGQYKRSLFAMIIYGLAVLIVSIISSKSIMLRRLLVGKPYLLMENGEISRENLKKSKLDINEFLTQLRVNGYFDLNEIETVLFEPDGRLSVLPKADSKAVTPKDLKLTTEKSRLCDVVVIDGKVMSENLSCAGYNEAWLNKQLSKQNISSVTEVFLGLISKQGTLEVYKMKNSIKEHTSLI